MGSLKLEHSLHGLTQYWYHDRLVLLHVHNVSRFGVNPRFEINKDNNGILGSLKERHQEI